MPIRSVVHIDAEKCDGCGLCAPACAEGAIRIIGGKAKVVSDAYCDGLGACLGHCPREAISISQREAEAFDEQAVARHVAATEGPEPRCSKGCPGASTPAWESRDAAPPPTARHSDRGIPPAQLANWPVQLHLVPPQAPFLQHADLLLVADCVPLACARFHSHVLDGRPVVIGCPKIDDCQTYVAKLAAMIQLARIQSISVVHMEVPCCTGLLRVAQTAIRRAEISIPLHSTVVDRRGEIFERHVVATDRSGNPTRDPAGRLPIL